MPHACWEAPGRCPVRHAAIPRLYTFSNTLADRPVALAIAGTPLTPGYLVWNLEEYDDGRCRVPRSVANGRYAAGFFHDIRARRVNSRCLWLFLRVDRPR